MVDRNALPYRPCVGIMLINRDRLVFVASRADTPGAWQMPQGGIDPGEDPRTAALRELEEETGVTSASVLGETQDWLRYELPDRLLGKVWGGRYRGQEQKWFAVAFTGADDEIDLDGPDGEFTAWRWAPASEVATGIVAFKRDVYQAVIAAFADHLR